MKMRLFVAFILTLLAFVVVSPSHALPSQFEDTLVAEISAPTDLTWTPDGRILVPAKGGQLWVVASGSVLPTPAINLAGVMCTNGERALGGVAVHPNFAANNYIYLYYTFNKFGTCNESEIDGPVNRLSRFVLPPNNVINPASELVLFDTASLFRDHHNGGDIAFGADGFLYVTVGDGGSQRFDWPQNPGQLLGKIIRLTDTGDIPPSNPFTGSNSARCNLNGVPPAGSPVGTRCQEVFSLGLRNPFRFAFDPNSSSTRFFINDVGQHTWEDISEGPVAGGNYGWPQREGPCVLDSTTDCTPPSGLIDPIHWYQHGVNGAAVTGGAFVPNGIWPASYNGSYMYADYVFGKIYQLAPGGLGCRFCLPPTSNSTVTEFTTAESVVGMAFGPHGTTQALYYVTRGFGPSSIDGLRRIAFVGTANRIPTAVATGSPTAGSPPLSVQFDGSGSSDPDGDALTYAWDFEGDSVTDSTNPSPAHIYPVAGTFLATLTVDDGRGGNNTTTIRIDVGNTPPLPVIETPIDGTTFYVGQVFTLHGRATDAEDGALPNSALSWEVRQHHATHFHPFLDTTTGNDIITPGAPEPEDLSAATNSYLEIRLTATDTSGLSTTVSRTIFPRVVNLTFNTVPQGLNLTLDGSTITTPITIVSWEAHQLTVSAPNQITASGTSYEWASWSDGGTQMHTIVVPPSPNTYGATFNQAATSTPTNLPTTTATSSGGTLTLNPVADSYVSNASPTSNYGNSTSIRTDNSPVIRSYLRFQVPTLSGSVVSAQLRVFATTANSLGYTVHGSSGGWGETTINFTTAPAFGGSVGSSGPVAANSWTVVDVTALVTGAGEFNLVMTSPSSTATSFSSRQGANSPQLIINVAGGPVPTAAPTNTPTNTFTPTNTLTPTSTLTATPAGSPTATPTLTATSTSTATPTTTRTVTPSSTPTATATHTATATLTATLTSTPPVSGGTLTLNPVADSYVSNASPTSNYGSNTSLRTDNSPVIRTYLRFQVPTLSGSVVSAQLRVFASSANSLGYMVHSTTGSWDEATINFTTAPPLGSSLGSSGPIAANSWTVVDVTALVTGAGEFNFVMASPSNTATSFFSRTGANPPQLVINLSGGTGAASVIIDQVVIPAPTEMPTVMPSETPTEMPTATSIVAATPSETPTEMPTATSMVVATPSETPTEMPTAAPMVAATPTEASQP